MQEVTRQLGPLADRVGLLSNNIERLYNSNGGPPGFLQNARKEDDGRFKMIFSVLDEHKNELHPLKKWTEAHDICDTKREEFQNKRDREIKDHLGRRDFWLMCAIGLLTLMMGILAYRDAIIKNTFAPPVPSVSSNQQQNAGSSMTPTH